MNAHFKIIISLLLILCSWGINAQETNYTTESNISYSPVIENPDQYQQDRCKLDLYYPTNRKGFATIVWFHGGGLTQGEKYIPEELKNSGYAIAAVNYRLTPKVNVHDCLMDAAASVAWVVKNIEQFGGSAEKIVVAGHSAGAYLTMMIGLDKRWMKPYAIDPDTFTALFPFSGNALSHMAYREERGIRPNQPYADDYAPMYHARAEAPPVVFFTGDRNMELHGRYEEVAFFWRIMKENGHKASFIYEMQGYDHGGMPAPAFPIMLRHLKQLLDGK